MKTAPSSNPKHWRLNCIGLARGDDGEPFEIGSFQGRLQIEVERPGD